MGRLIIGDSSDECQAQRRLLAFGSWLLALSFWPEELCCQLVAAFGLSPLAMAALLTDRLQRRRRQLPWPPALYIRGSLTARGHPTSHRVRFLQKYSSAHPSGPRRCRRDIPLPTRVGNQTWALRRHFSRSRHSADRTLNVCWKPAGQDCPAEEY